VSLTAVFTSITLVSLTSAPQRVPAPEPFQPQVSDPLLAPPPPPEVALQTWQEAHSLLRRNSIDEQVAEAAVTRAEGRWRQALGAMLPNVRLTTSVLYDLLNPGTPALGPAAVAAGAAGGATTSGTSRPTVPVGTASVNLTLSVIDIGAWRNLASNSAASQSAQSNASDVRRRVTLGLARSLVALVAAERVAELNRLGLSQALERSALTARTQQLGAATLLDVTRVKQDVEVARGNLIFGDEQLMRTREALGLLLGLDKGAGVGPGFALDGLVDEVRQRCPSVNWEQRGDLESARLNVSSANASRQQAVAGYLPTLGITSNAFGFTTDPGFGRFVTWNIAAVLAFPLWEGGTREGLVKERRGLQEQAKANFEGTRRQVSMDVNRARRSVKVAQDLLAAASTARELSAQIDSLTRRAFEVGRGTSLELVQSAAALRQSDVLLATREFELVQARLDAYLTEAQCEW